MSGDATLAAAVARLVTARTGLAFPPHRLGAVPIAIENAMRRCGLADVQNSLVHLAKDGPPLAALVDELTVGETFFFRDAVQFDFIRRVILPDILRRNGAMPWLWVWSAGCASGEEAYSLAILFEQEGLATRTRIFATDLSHAALAKARAGIYGGWSLRQWPGVPLTRYFVRCRGRYRIAERLRASLAFTPLNLAADPYPGMRPDAPVLDLILCRNVLIHLDPAWISVIAQRLFAALADGGWLVTGASDPPLGRHAPFEVIASEAGLVYRRVPGRAILPAEAPPAAPPAPVAWALPVAPPPCGSPMAPLPGRPEVALSAESQLAHGLALMSLGRYDAAAQAVRRALYLDSDFAVAHVVLGVILWRCGDLGGARREYRTAEELAAALPPGATPTGGEGLTAAEIAAAAAAQRDLVDHIGGAA